MLLRLDPARSTPLYRQICERIVALIEEGTLRPGDRLPPTRDLATSAGVHRSTVVRAYEEIHALGYSESRSGAYTTVRHRPRLPATATATATAKDDSVRRPAAINWAACAARHPLGANGLGLGERAGPAGVIDFDRLKADPELAPCEDLRRCLRSAVSRAGSSAFDYADPAGWRPLREAVSQRLRTHGIAVTAEEILITSGAQQALDLVFRLLLREGDRVVVEAPTYGVAHALLRLHGGRPVEIPMQQDGMDLDALERAVARVQPKLVYTMPSFHNPTGVTTDQAHRERLLSICERARVPLLEDAFEEEMKYFGRAVLPIKSMDVRGVVLYVGTFSKVVFPGLRVGWIAAPREAISALTSIQYASSLAVNTVAQIAAERFCRGGGFETHLRRVHRVYRQRMQVLLRGLDEHMPVAAQWTQPQGGYCLWLTLPPPARSEPLWVDRLAESRVRAAPGSRFFAQPPAGVHFRLSIACLAEARIREGCRRLGRALARARFRRRSHA